MFAKAITPRERCQARRPGRLLEATCKRCPRGMAVTYRPAQADDALQNPAYRPADTINEGFGAATPDPSPVSRRKSTVSRVAGGDSLMLHWARAGDIVLKRSSRCIGIMVALATAAIAVAGCANSQLVANNAASSPSTGTQASSGPAQAQRSSGDQAGSALYGGGFTTDLYTELFRSGKSDDKTAPTNDTSAPASVPGPIAAAPIGPANVVASNIGQPNQPTPAPGVQPETAAAEPPHATVYGIPSNGETTDLYTELFGPRRRE
jgi:hypothetical protein